MLQVKEAESSLKHKLQHKLQNPCLGDYADSRGSSSQGKAGGRGDFEEAQTGAREAGGRR